MLSMGTQAKPDIDHVQEELADVLMYCIMMADVLNVNMNDVILSKLESNKRKYPVKAVQSDPHAFEELHWQAKGY